MPLEKSQKETAKEAIDKILDAVNIMGDDTPVVDGVMEALQMTHRTLQENFWRVMIEVMKQYSEFRADPRNQGAVDFCKFVTEKLEEEPSKAYLPYI